LIVAGTAGGEEQRVDLVGDRPATAARDPRMTDLLEADFDIDHTPPGAVI